MSRISIISRFALIAARRTSFFGGPSNGVFGVFVRQGHVDVRTRRRVSPPRQRGGLKGAMASVS
jgi:hypothetical protein